MISKPSIPKGTRDFSTDEMIRRELIFDTIRKVFRIHGYQPIETPSVEYLSTLLGKYGEEGDRLIFRILNSGDFLAGVSDNDLAGREPSRLSSLICEKGLRYDLTVPFARYVVQHREEILFPFKRYQIQPVWRADRPQKGRYREFFQCDADVIGSDSLLNEYELTRIIDEVFKRLNIPVIIKINNRKLLSGIAWYIGQSNRLTDITVAIDKLDKLDKTGIGAIISELEGKGIPREAIEKLQPFLKLEGNADSKLTKLGELLSGSDIAMKGISELREFFRYLEGEKMSAAVELDMSLARGLNYYTGAIIEVKSAGVEMGSVCGGGRYDNLTGIFGLEGISGVGISFGADRIYDVMNHLDLFDKIPPGSTEVLVINFGDTGIKYAMKIVELLRMVEVRSELYPDNMKIKKQLSYADSKKIPFVIMAGEEEMKENKLSIKNMTTGEQQKIALTDLLTYIGKVVGRND
jgi:histidyl-tRNA synthetase